MAPEILKRVKWKFSGIILAIKKYLDIRQYYAKHKHLAKQKKVIYALTPPARLKNIGDHAQVVAINQWLKRTFPDWPVIEVDKDEVTYYIAPLKKIVGEDDIIILHSGGNLGDRGIWSETARRLVIREFPDNQIVSLPQTIYFSDTDCGQQEKEKTREIYGRHHNLTIIGRDPESGDLAEELFPHATTFCMPDFVLSLPQKSVTKKALEPKILLCLRQDDESVLNSEDKGKIANSISYKTEFFDTTIDQDIKPNEREDIVNKTLDFFSDFDVVVTDRYHGLIFTILAQKPCVVLRTVDHKLTSAMYWFRDIPSIFFAEDLSKVPNLVKQCLEIEEIQSIDWNEKYFNRIKGYCNFEKSISQI